MLDLELGSRRKTMGSLKRLGWQRCRWVLEEVDMVADLPSIGHSCCQALGCRVARS